MLSHLHLGFGVAKSYLWREKQFEIEVTRAMHVGTFVKDAKFKCASGFLDLRLCGGAEGETLVLLDNTWHIHGKLCVDGTSWSLGGTGLDR